MKWLFGNMYEFYEIPLPSSDFDQETKTFAVPTPMYSDPSWEPEPSNLSQEQVRELIAEWLG